MPLPRCLKLRPTKRSYPLAMPSNTRLNSPKNPRRSTPNCSLGMGFNKVEHNAGVKLRARKPEKAMELAMATANCLYITHTDPHIKPKGKNTTDKNSEIPTSPPPEIRRTHVYTPHTWPSRT